MNIKFEVEGLQSVISGSSLFLYFDLVETIPSHIDKS